MPCTGYIVNPSGQQQWACSVGNFIVNFGAIGARLRVARRQMPTRSRSSGLSSARSVVMICPASCWVSPQSRSD